MTRLTRFKWIAAWFAPFAILIMVLVNPVTTVTPAFAQASPDVLGNDPQTDFWRAIRQGEQGTVSIPDKNAAQLIQSEGDNWRAWRNGPVTVSGAWIVLGMLGLVGLGTWAAIESSTFWAWLSFGAAGSLLLSAIAIAWPIQMKVQD